MEIPKIIVTPPGPKSKEFLTLRNKYVSPGVYLTIPIVIKQAHGIIVEDLDGNIFLDFTTGIGVVNAGHTPRRVVDVIKRQVSRLIHICIHVASYESYLLLAEKLCNIVPIDGEKMAYFLNSGAEAVENAVKLSFYYTKRNAIITFENAFHGRTLLTMALTSKVEPYKKGFRPYVPGIIRFPFAYCYRCPFNQEYDKCGLLCLDFIKRGFITYVDPYDVAAIIVEPVQGEGGYIVPPKDFIYGLREIADQYNIVFIDDEVQSGMGRTGKLFAIEHFDVKPDIIVLSKSLGSGLPISAVVGRKEILDKIHVGGVGGTFGGNPVSCAAALETIEIIRKNLGRGERIGKVMRRRLVELYNKYEIIGDVRGLGPMMAIEIVKDRKTKVPDKDLTKKIIMEAYKRGLLLLSAGIYGNVIRLIPPITAPITLVKKGLDILDDAISSALSL